MIFCLSLSVGKQNSYSAIILSGLCPFIAVLYFSLQLLKNFFDRMIQMIGRKAETAGQCYYSV